MTYKKKIKKKEKNNLIIFTSIFLFIGIYFLVIKEVINPNKIQDFTSFYAAILNLISHKNPYTIIVTNFLVMAEKIPPNLNPPIVLFLFSPLAKFSYSTALLIWINLSFFLGLIGAGIAFYYAAPNDFLKKNCLYFYLIYFACFSTIINLILMQFGTLLLFFMMLGYHFYLRNQDFLSGLTWGLIICFKLFPALLIFFVLKQKRVKVFFFIVLTVFLASAIPYFFYGRLIYSQYLSLMSSVFWYGDNWNASLLGYIVRLLVNQNDIRTNMVLIDLIYAVLFFITFLVYLKQLGSQTKYSPNHQPFCLTITMMLLMSPFGWIYYFPILVFPLTLTWFYANELRNHTLRPMLIWLTAFILINFSQSYITHSKLVIFSFNIMGASLYFYGLVLLNYLCAKNKKIFLQKEVHLDQDSYSFLLIISLFLLINVIVTLLKFVLHLIK